MTRMDSGGKEAERNEPSWQSRSQVNNTHTEEVSRKGQNKHSNRVTEAARLLSRSTKDLRDFYRGKGGNSGGLPEELSVHRYSIGTDE